MARRLPKNRDMQLAAIGRVLDLVDAYLSTHPEELLVAVGTASSPKCGLMTIGELRTHVQSARLLNVLPQRRKRTSRGGNVRRPRPSTVDTLERSLSEAGGRSR
jgi:hypothetical protein